MEQALDIHADGLAHFLAEACGPAPTTDALANAIAANHCYNCRLWLEEDLVRRTGVPNADMVANKRAIDRFNQARNDATERLDEHLLLTLPVPQPDARHHSETPGSMVDRLSILTLKIHHMAPAGAPRRGG